MIIGSSVVRVEKRIESSHYREKKIRRDKEMKKIIASAVGLIMFGGVAVTTASAVENKFGGYWRTRIFSQSDMSKGADFWRADNRTRLYYTAKFNDDFKFVNKFEFNSSWGDDNGGDIGADGDTMKIKNSYADFTMGSVNTKLGIHAGVIARGFIFDDDFSGATVTLNFGNISVPLMWARVDGEYVSANAVDDDILAAQVKIKIGDTANITPYVVYRNADANTEDFYLGVDADMNFGAGSGWATAIYQGGTVTNADGDTEIDSDKAAYLFALGGSVSVVHGQFFYATGEETTGNPGDDNDAFYGVAGASYYWAEIMGLGTFDAAASAGSPANVISNIWAGNVGVKFKPMDKLTLGADLWYASLAEENALGDDELGTEIDLKLTYGLMDNLNLDLVVAYLAAGDATIAEDDPIEFGARLSLKF